MIETDWADASRAVEQLQPAAVLAADGRDRPRPAFGALAEADRGAPALSAADRGRSRDRACPTTPFRFSRRSGNSDAADCAPARRAARPDAACDRDAPAGCRPARDDAQRYRSVPRCDRAADRPRRRLPCAFGVARRADGRGRRAQHRSRGETPQHARHRRHRARRRFQPARGGCLPHRAGGGCALPQPACGGDVGRTGADLRSAQPRNHRRRAGAASPPTPCR